MEKGEKPMTRQSPGKRNRVHDPFHDYFPYRCFYSSLIHGWDSGRLFHEFAVTIGIAILISGSSLLLLRP